MWWGYKERRVNFLFTSRSIEKCTSVKKKYTLLAEPCLAAAIPTQNLRKNDGDRGQHGGGP